jgi:4-amino-4-deoxy-L-arabinose transferase-like glycosyltransferase
MQISELKLSPRSRRFFRQLSVILLIALLLRLATTLACWRIPILNEYMATPPDVTDMATYLDYSRRCLQGTYQGDFNYQPFYYTVFLPVTMTIGDHPLLLALIQSFLGTFTCLFCALTAAQLSGRRAGLIAALLLAPCSMMLIYVPFALIEVLAAFFISLFLYTSILAWRRNQVRYWLLAVAILAAATLTRGTALLLLPPLLALLAWKNRRHLGRASGQILAACIVFWGLQLPWSWHNYEVTGHWVGPSTDLPEVLPFGNAPDASPGELYTSPLNTEWQRLSKLPVDPVPVSQSLIQSIKKEPAAWAELKLRCLLLFLDHGYIPNNINEDIIEAKIPWLKVLPNWGLLAALGLAGLFLIFQRHRRPGHIFVAALTILAAAGIIGLYILSRFKVPFLPFCAVLGAHALSQASWRTWAAPLALGLCCTFLMHSSYAINLQPKVDHWARPNGTQVRIGDTLTISDHGPERNDWGAWQINADTTRIQKTFRCPALAGKSVPAQITLLFQCRQAALLTMSSGEAPNPGRARLIPVSPMENDDIGSFILDPLRLHFNDQGEATIILFLSSPQAGLSIFFDTRRNHARTRAATDKSPEFKLVPELVMILNLPAAALDVHQP